MKIFARRVGVPAALLWTMLSAITLSAQTPQAQEPGDTVLFTLPGVEVIVSILPAAGPASGSGVPARVATIPGASVEAWAPRLVTEVLVQQAGISFYDDLGSPFKTTLVTRGFTASPVVGLPQGISVFLDGVPINEPDARQVNFDLLPLEHIQRIELLSGTASLLGPNSLGGALNLITHGGGGPLRGQIQADVGSFDARSVQGSVRGSSPRLTYYAGGSYDEEGGWREFTSAERASGLLNMGRGGVAGGARLQAFLARSYAETAGSLPLSVYGIRPRTNLTEGDFEDLRQLHLALSGFRTFEGGRAAGNLFLRAHNAERFNVNQINDPDVRSFSENRTLGASADWSTSRVRDGAAIGMRIGATGTLNSADIRIFAERIEAGLTTHVRSPISDGGIFGIADLARGPWTVSGGLRLDAVHIPFRNLLDSARDTTSFYLQLNPRAGVSYDVGGGATVYSSLGRSFRAPAVIELACADPENPCPLPFALGDDPPLDPVTAVTYELGGRWNRGGATLSGAIFRTDVSNDIFLFPYADEDEPVGSTIDGFFANIEATRREGIELDTRLVIGPRGSVYLNYAFTSATFQVDDLELFSIREEAGGENEVEEGDRLPLVPDHTLRSGIDIGLAAGVEIGLSARYTGRRWLRGDEANEEEPLDGYLLADARLGWSWRGWSANLLIRNLLDTRFATFGTFNLHQAADNRLERFLTPGEPRSVRLMVRRRFGD